MKAKAKTSWQQTLDHPLIRWVGLPLAIYTLLFIYYFHTQIPQFSTAFWADAGDGLQNVWNIWWVNQAVTVLHTNPWYTHLLHWPEGVSLLGQTLNPFNGFLGVGLLKLFTLVQTFNLIVWFSFAFCGVTACWLTYEFSKSYWASVVAGAVFTFSSFHLAHAQGHLQLISLEWIPLFVLAFWRLLQRVSYRWAVAAGLSLFLVILCDYYLFLYCVFIGAIMAVYYAITNRHDLPVRRLIKPMLLFGLIAAVTCGPLVYSLIHLNATDPLSGSHPADQLSNDLLAAFVYGPAMLLGRWTQAISRHWTAGGIEDSVSLGLATLGLLVASLVLFKRLRPKKVVLWYTIGIVFWLLSLGPRLHIEGHTYHRIRLPYTLLTVLIPSLKLSGVPVRFMVIAILAAAVVVGLVLSEISLKRRHVQVLVALLLLVMAVEAIPRGLPATPATEPGYITALQHQPDRAGVLDEADTAPYALYYAALDDKPLVYGYISRTPQSVSQKDDVIETAWKSHNYTTLCTRYQIRYLISQQNLPLPAISNHGGIKVYDLKSTPKASC